MCHGKIHSWLLLPEQKEHRAAVGSTVWGPTYFEGDSGVIVLCTMFLVSSSVNVSIFHIMWLDNFWTELLRLRAKFGHNHISQEKILCWEYKAMRELQRVCSEEIVARGVVSMAGDNMVVNFGFSCQHRGNTLGCSLPYAKLRVLSCHWLDVPLPGWLSQGWCVWKPIKAVHLHYHLQSSFLLLWSWYLDIYLSAPSSMSPLVLDSTGIKERLNIGQTISKIKHNNPWDTETRTYYMKTKKILGYCSFWRDQGRWL